MASIKIAALFLFVFAVAKGCELNQQEMTKVAFSCAASAAKDNPSFLIEISEQFGGNGQKMDLKFICKYESELVEVVNCVLNQVKECVPAEVKPFMTLIPSKEQMLDGMHFICQHKNILDSHCMDDHVQAFMSCYQNRVTQLVAAMQTQGNAINPKDIMCKVIHSEEQCFTENKGACTDAFLKVLFEALEKFFPLSDCPQTQKIDNKFNSLLGSVLVHGQPGLKFLPRQNNPYVVTK